MRKMHLARGAWIAACGVACGAACGGGGGGGNAVPDGPADAAPPDADDSAVTGRWLDTYHYAGGSVDASTSLAGATIRAVVWNGVSWDVFPGTGSADGSFSIPDVQHGELTLQIGVDSI